jgi:hypothetical protein
VYPESGNSSPRRDRHPLRPVNGTLTCLIRTRRVGAGAGVLGRCSVLGVACTRLVRTGALRPAATARRPRPRRRPTLLLATGPAQRSRRERPAVGSTRHRPGRGKRRLPSRALYSHHPCGMESVTTARQPRRTRQPQRRQSTVRARPGCRRSLCEADARRASQRREGSNRDIGTLSSTTTPSSSTFGPAEGLTATPNGGVVVHRSPWARRRLATERRHGHTGAACR